MNPRISIITLGVKDLSVSTDFYQRMKFTLSPYSQKGAISFFESKYTWLALFPKDKLAEDASVSGEGTGFNGFSLAQNVANKEEVDRVLELARAEGAKITKSPMETDWGGYSGYFADPDGYLWEIAYNPFFKFD
ncbi:VOC family protein [Candidatus Parcubacteria bacterium]|nr:VOC family protein [Candidatus Parcubacteria bacterium]